MNKTKFIITLDTSTEGPNMTVRGTSLDEAVEKMRLALEMSAALDTITRKYHPTEESAEEEVGDE